LAELRARASADNVAGMRRFGISSQGTLGVSVAEVRLLARDARRAVGRDPRALHEVAAELWSSSVHEAAIMATVLDEPGLVTRGQAEHWVLDLDSWDICDQLCGNLLWRCSFAWDLPAEWSTRAEPYVKRAGFVVAAQLAVKDKRADDRRFLSLLALVEREAGDARNEVKKGMNWALRQIGKRSSALNREAISCAESIKAAAGKTKPSTPGSRAALWIANDALRELRGEAVQARLA
jgi:3-methyladenine DNA glycosylase AlkD